MCGSKIDQTLFFIYSQSIKMAHLQIHIVIHQTRINHVGYLQILRFLHLLSTRMSDQFQY